MSKESLREEIARLTEEYLARGGVIEQVPKVIFCPPHMEWARRRGLDWTSWKHIGDWNHGKPEETTQLELVEHEGCYLTVPAPFEGSDEDFNDG